MALLNEIKPSAWDAKTEEPHIICNDCAASAPVYIWQRLGSEEEVNERNCSCPCISGTKISGV